MELELGLKLTKVIDDFTTAEFLIAKDRSGPLFLTSETETTFILTAHLKGYRKRNIKIDINKDGTRITIRGEKPVQEMVMVGWKMYKKEVEMRGFRKAFIIPNGVCLDKIKAKFNEDESILTISMPKLAKGLVGGGIEEVKEEEIVREESESKVTVGDEVEKKEKEFENLGDKKEEQGDSMVTYPDEDQGKEFDGLEGKMDINGEETERKKPEIEKAQEIREHENDEIHQLESKIMGGKEKEKEREESREVTQEEEVLEHQDDEEHDQIENSSLKQPMNEDQHEKDQEVEEEEKINGTENEIQEGEEMVEDVNECAEEERKRETQREKPNPKKHKLCVPFIAGSALLVSLIVLVIHMIRTKNKHINVRAKRQ